MALLCLGSISLDSTYRDELCSEFTRGGGGVSGVATCFQLCPDVCVQK